jgi:hypothetical protein
VLELAPRWRAAGCTAYSGDDPRLRRHVDRVSAAPSARRIAAKTTVIAGDMAGTAALPPQAFATPPPPHVWEAAQEPQERVPPQPSATTPQFLPSALHVMGVHAPMQDVGPQISSGVHAPHWMRPPQRSDRGPQERPCDAHDTGVHAPVPHDVAPQVCPEGHDPQLMTVPQPSVRMPQETPCAAQVSGVHAARAVVGAHQATPTRTAIATAARYRCFILLLLLRKASTGNKTRHQVPPDGGAQSHNRATVSTEALTSGR